MKTTQQSKNLPPVSALLHNIRADTQDDAFSGDDLQAVMDSEDHFCQEYFLDENRILCFRRAEGVVA